MKRLLIIIMLVFLPSAACFGADNDPLLKNAPLVEFSTMPAAGTDPDVDAAGEIGRDTDDHSLRGYDGSAQYIYGQKIRTITCAIAKPLDLDEADNYLFWENRTGFSFEIISIYSRTEIDDVVYTLKEMTDMTDFSASTTIEELTVDTNGTAVFYDFATTSELDHTTIETGHGIAFDNDSADDPDSLTFTITGYLVGDVD